MGLGIAKVDQHAIPKVLRNVAVKAVNDLCTHGLIGPDDVPVVFGIKLAGEGHRIDEIAEQDSELAAFGLRSMRDRWWRHWRRICVPSGERRLLSGRGG